MQAVHLISIQKHWNSITSSIAFTWIHGAKSDVGVNKLDQLLLFFDQVIIFFLSDAVKRIYLQTIELIIVQLLTTLKNVLQGKMFSI